VNIVFILPSRVHQVNSFGNNLAVNIWFVHSPFKYIDLTPEKCGKHKKNLTLDKVSFQSTDIYNDSVNEGNDENENAGNTCFSAFYLQ